VPLSTLSAAKESRAGLELEAKDTCSAGVKASCESNTLNNGLDFLVADQAGGKSDCLHMYLREISRIPLLSLEEEANLAQRLQRGRLERLKGEAEADSHLIAVGEQARRILIEANLRLVVNVAKKYSGLGLNVLDLIQEGNMGLIHATRGYKFSTYAIWWIRQAMTRAVAGQMRVIRLPVYMAEKIHRLMRLKSRLLQELGREPTLEEVGKELAMSAEQVQELVLYSQQPKRLEMPVNRGRGSPSWERDPRPDGTGSG
jgi:RNA polymerase primary sigma factor